LVVVVTRDEPWRSPTGIRFVERLKRKLYEEEEQFLNRDGRLSFEQCLADRQAGLSQTERNDYLQACAVADRSIAEQKARISKIMRAQASDEITDLEATIEKLDLDKAEVERLVKEISERHQALQSGRLVPVVVWWERVIFFITPTAKLPGMLQRCEQEREAKRARVLEINRGLIEARHDLAELKTWVANASPRPEPAPEASQKTEDDIKMDQAKDRARRDLRFKIKHEAGKKFQTLLELKQWRKDARHEVREMHLPEDEENELLDAIEHGYNEQLKKLKVDTGVFEDT